MKPAVAAQSGPAIAVVLQHRNSRQRTDQMDSPCRCDGRKKTCQTNLCASSRRKTRCRRGKTPGTSTTTGCGEYGRLGDSSIGLQKDPRHMQRRGFRRSTNAKRSLCCRLTLTLCHDPASSICVIRYLKLDVKALMEISMYGRGNSTQCAG